MIFKKVGKTGRAAIVPIYNIIFFIQVAGLSLWYLVLLIIPFANIYAIFKIYIELAHKFGKSTGFGVLTVFFSEICLPILAFDYNVMDKKIRNHLIPFILLFYHSFRRNLHLVLIFCHNLSRIFLVLM